MSGGALQTLMRRRPSTPAAPPLLEPERPRAELPRELLRYAHGRARWRPGGQVTVLRDGDQAFPAKLAAIHAAKRSVCLEIYIFEHDHIGQQFIDALCARAREGLQVRLLYDAVGSFGLPIIELERMREDGVQLVEFHPIAPWRRRFNLSRRDHRKILVVDDEIAFVGGLNLGKEYASIAQGGVGWHDMHCSLRGPIVADLARTFRRNWVTNGGADYPAPRRAEDQPPGDGPSWVRMIDNTLRKRRRAIRRAYVDVIHAAKAQVFIKNAYFLPGAEIRHAIARALARGVDVAVIVPGTSDVRLVEWAGLYAHRQLAKAGARILRWPGVMMHAKTAVIDGVWSTIGSYNLDSRSLRYNLEITVEILDRDVGGELARQFTADAQTCELFHESTWLAIPWWKRALAWCAYRLRRWL
ncbi:MAG: phosphatidylserine/phosphatidylglycerophosphate/cardiolipin synthase family protein [Kofleriaceae bacterium]